MYLLRNAQLTFGKFTIPWNSVVNCFNQISKLLSLASFYFRSFWNKQYNFYNKLMWKNIHQVYGNRIPTFNLLTTTLLQKPLEQGSNPISKLLGAVAYRKNGQASEKQCDQKTFLYLAIWTSENLPNAIQNLLK